MHADDRERVLASLDQVLQSGDTFRDSCRIVSPDGSVLWAVGSGEVARDDSGRATSPTGVVIDITEQKHSEETLRLAAQGNAKSRTLFDQGSQFIAVVALDGTVMEANRASLEGCGFTPEDVVGLPFWACGWSNRDAEVIERVRSATMAAAGGETVRMELPLFMADGRERIGELILAPVRDDEGRIILIAASGSDITDRRRTEDELREADRRKDESLAMLAHELRNPLSVISNGIQLAKTVQRPELLAELRETIQHQVAHLNHLIDDLLDVSRITQGKFELRTKTVDLAAVVGGAVEW